MKTSNYLNIANKWITDLANQGKSLNTLKTYKNALKVFYEYLQNQEIEEITQEALINFKNDLTEQKSNGKVKISTINTRIITLNKFFKENGEPELKLKVEKEQRKHVLDNVLSLTDYNRLLRWAEKLGMERESLIMQTLVGTGIRISELEFFTVEALSKLKNKRNNKGLEIKNKGKTRKVYPPKKLVNDLLNYAKKNGIEEGVIFQGRDPNKMLDKTLIWKNLKYIAGRARVSKAKTHAHSFRHLFALEYLDRPNANISQLADILGHSNLETTRIYLTETSAQQQKDVESVAESIERKMKELNRK